MVRPSNLSTLPVVRRGTFRPHGSVSHDPPPRNRNVYPRQRLRYRAAPHLDVAGPIPHFWRRAAVRFRGDRFAVGARACSSGEDVSATGRNDRFAECVHRGPYPVDAPDRRRHWSIAPVPGRRDATSGHHAKRAGAGNGVARCFTGSTGSGSCCCLRCAYGVNPCLHPATIFRCCGGGISRARTGKCARRRVAGNCERCDIRTRQERIDNETRR